MDTIAKLSRAYKKGEKSVVETTTEYLSKIERNNKCINAYIFKNSEQALERARYLDENKEKYLDKKLFGIPVAIKDNIDCQGQPLTCGSKILGEYVSPKNAFVVDRLLRDGAVLLGKANMDEFAMGSANLNSSFGPVQNPWDRTRVPGGSSGGSAAAVAADMCVASLGSDTGGSIRQPASFCGVYGLKPTYGRVSRRGLTAFASSLDQIGPIAKNTEDLQVVYDCIQGFDEKDSTSIKDINNLSTGFKSGCSKKKLAVFEESFADSVETEVKDTLSDFLDALSKEGATITKLSFKSLKFAVATYYILATAEASSNLSRFDGVRYGMRVQQAKTLKELYEKTRSEGFGSEVKKRILLGTYVLSAGYFDAYYQRAMAAREMMQRELLSIFQDHDFVIGPTTPNTAFKIEQTFDDLQLYANDIFTIPANICGVPALSVPLALSSERLPIGLQITAPHFAEQSLLNFSSFLEEKALVLDQGANFVV